MQKKYFLKQDKSRLILSSSFFSLFHSFSSFFFSFFLSVFIFECLSSFFWKKILFEGSFFPHFFFSLSLIFQPIYFFKDFFLLVSFFFSFFLVSFIFPSVLRIKQIFMTNDILTDFSLEHGMNNRKREEEKLEEKERKYQRVMEKEQLFHPSKKESFFSDRKFFLSRKNVHPIK